MMKLGRTDIIKRLSVEEIAAHRARALEECARGLAALGNAAEAWRRAAVSHYGPSGSILSHDAWHSDYHAKTLEKFRKELDAAIWRYLIDATGLASLMDAKAMEEFREGLKDPMPATAENLTATVFDKLGQAQQIFRRGLVKAFEALHDHGNKRFKSNGRFALGDGVKVDNFLTVDQYFTRQTWREDTVRDCDRTMFVLDGKMFPQEYRAPVTLAGSININVKGGRDAGPWEGETEYWTWKVFKNGSLHLRFKRPDLRDAANRVIAHHYGEVLADATH